MLPESHLLPPGEDFLARLGALIMDDTPVPTLSQNMRRLVEESRRAAKQPTFIKGDWVTPRHDVSIKGYGEPNLVIGIEGSSVHVISIVADLVHPRTIEAWLLEPWDQAKHEEA